MHHFACFYQIGSNELLPHYLTTVCTFDEVRGPKCLEFSDLGVLLGREVEQVHSKLNKRKIKKGNWEMLMRLLMKMM